MLLAQFGLHVLEASLDEHLSFCQVSHKLGVGVQTLQLARV